MTTTVKRKARLEYDQSGQPVQGCLHPDQTVSVAYTSVAGVISAAIIAQIVRIWSTTACHVKFSPSGTLAQATDMYLAANTPEKFTMGGDQYISAIQDSSGGTLYITLMD